MTEAIKHITKKSKLLSSTTSSSISSSSSASPNESFSSSIATHEYASPLSPSSQYDNKWYVNSIIEQQQQQLPIIQTHDQHQLSTDSGYYASANSRSPSPQTHVMTAYNVVDEQQQEQQSLIQQAEHLQQHHVEYMNQSDYGYYDVQQQQQQSLYHQIQPNSDLPYSMVNYNQLAFNPLQQPTQQQHQQYDQMEVNNNFYMLNSASAFQPYPSDTYMMNNTNSHGALGYMGSVEQNRHFENGSNSKTLNEYDSNDTCSMSGDEDDDDEDDDDDGYYYEYAANTMNPNGFSTETGSVINSQAAIGFGQHMHQSTPTKAIKPRQNQGSQQSNKRKRKRILNKTQRAEATLREKRRMLKLNKAFEDLRKVLPISDFAKNKLSRAETLKSAIEYIDKMSEMLLNY